MTVCGAARFIEIKELGNIDEYSDFLYLYQIWWNRGFGICDLPKFDRKYDGNFEIWQKSEF